jgi:hypothetical protein
MKPALQDTRDQFRALLEAASDAIVIVNQQGEMFWSIPRPKTCLGLPRGIAGHGRNQGSRCRLSASNK